MANPKILHDNRFDDGTPVASTTAAGYDVLNLIDWRAFNKWQPSALPATVTVDCGSAQSADYALIWGHDLFTQSATLQVRGSTDNFSASDVLVATTTPTDDRPFLLEWASTSYRYWRIRITGSTMPTIAIAAIGAALVMPQALTEGFDPLGREPRGTFSRTVAGRLLNRIYKYQEWSATLRFDFVTWSWLRSTWVPAWDVHLHGEPFGFAWETTSHPTELALITITGGFSTPHKIGNLAELTFTVTGDLG